MHVAVFADLEGAFGIWRMRQCRTGTAAWQYGRECLTADVNAVVRGAFDDGATVRFTAPNMTEGFEVLNKLTFFPRRIYPVRRAVLAAARGVYSIRSRFLAPEPDREGALDPELARFLLIDNADR